MARRENFLARKIILKLERYPGKEHVRLTKLFQQLVTNSLHAIPPLLVFLTNKLASNTRAKTQQNIPPLLVFFTNKLASNTRAKRNRIFKFLPCVGVLHQQARVEHSRQNTTEYLDLLRIYTLRYVI